VWKVMRRCHLPTEFCALPSCNSLELPSGNCHVLFVTALDARLSIETRVGSK
jgi:hypothetical protein